MDPVVKPRYDILAIT
ncbi:MAG: hypothetical protein ACEY3D_08935 [Rickettsia sp.]